MAKQTRSTSSAAASAAPAVTVAASTHPVVPDPVVVATVDEPTPAPKASRGGKKKALIAPAEESAVAPVTPVPVVSAPVAPVVEHTPAPVVMEEVSAPASEESNEEGTAAAAVLTVPEYVKLVERFNSVSTQFNELRGLIKSMAKESNRREKELNKLTIRRKLNREKRTPSGFRVPTKISDALASFILVPSGTEMVRSDVTKIIHKYIVDNNLQNPENRRCIMYDPTLYTMLNADPTVQLTYFSIQSHLKSHFAKKEKVPSSAVSA
jgi:chromatin remodeling complex protein RSC6